MKKTNLFKRVVSLLIVVTISLSFYTFANASNIEKNGKEILEEQKISIKKYNKILSGLKEKDNSKYYKYYGGAYIGDEGELVVLLTKVSSENISKVKNLSGDDSIEIKQCKYSYSELLEVISKINNNIDSLYEQGIIIDEMYDDIWANKVIISICDLDVNKEKVVRKVINKDFMEFINSEGGLKEESVDIKGGYRIVSDDNYATSTLSFCATRNGVDGYVIAGHSGNNICEEFKYNGNIIGEVTDTAYYNNSTADAAFVEANNYGNLTDEVIPGDIVGALTTDLPVGTTITMYGTYSGLENGTILSYNYSATINGITIKDTVKASYDSTSGDSGGPVLLYEGSYGGESRYSIVGNHRGASQYNAFYSKYKNIANELNISAKIY